MNLCFTYFLTYLHTCKQEMLHALISKNVLGKPQQSPDRPSSFDLCWTLYGFHEMPCFKYYWQSLLVVLNVPKKT